MPYHGSNQHATLSTANGNMRRTSFDASRSTSASSARPPSFRSHIPCKFFRSGCCFRGDQCHFSHDLNSQQQTTDSALEEDANKEISVSPDEGDIHEENSPTTSSSVVLNAAGRPVGTLSCVDDSMPLAWTLAPAPSKLSQHVLPSVANDTSSEQQQHKVCKFFLRGMCAHGDSCRYNHQASTASNLESGPETVRRKDGFSASRAPAVVSACGAHSRHEINLHLLVLPCVTLITANADSSLCHAAYASNVARLAPS